MIEIGKYHDLEIIREAEQGIYLADKTGNEVLLPNRYLPEQFKIWETIRVFVYLDNEERLVAVTDKPYMTKGDFALLRCNAVTDFGAFLDWGMLKELFCPFKEQAFKMKKGGWYLVYCYQDDKTGRLVASSKTNRFLDNSNLSVSVNEEVDIIVSHPSEFGMNVIVNNKHSGLIYKDDIYKDLHIGDRHKAYIKKVRQDNKLDISLSQIGYRNIEPTSQIILDALNDNSGFLPLHDKSDPEQIKAELQMSKKAFKKAIGSLYKARQIEIKTDGIYTK